MVFAMPRKELLDIVFMRFLLKSNFIKVVLVSAKSTVGLLRKKISRSKRFRNLLLSRLISSYQQFKFLYIVLIK